MALAGRGVDVDALSAGAAHGGLGAGQDPVAEAAPLAVGMHGDPVEVVAGDRPGNRAVAGIAAQAAVLLQQHELVARTDERRVGKEWVGTWTSRWSPVH